MHNSYVSSIMLTDYTKIKCEDEKICKSIQDQIDTGSFNVLNIFDEENKSPKVFKCFNNEYWTQQYVGIIKTKVEHDNNEKIVIIGSRFDESKNQHFLNFVFSKVFGIEGKIFKDMLINSSMEQSWDILLMLLFIYKLEEALKQGIYRKYKNFEHNDSKVKGKIDMSRHIKENFINSGKIAYTTREYTADNDINNLILLAYDCLKVKYINFDNIVRKKNIINDGIKLLKNYVSNYKSISVNKILNDTNKQVTHSLYIKYEPLRKISIMILKRMGVNVFENDNNESFGVLINMNKLWEKFLTETVLNNKYISDIKEQERKDVIFKIDEGKIDNGKREFKPDYYIKDKAVFDAKYRAAWQETLTSDKWTDTVRNDIFQIFSYMLIFNVKIGGVIFPYEGVKEAEIYKYNILNEPDNDGSFWLIPYKISKHNNYFEFEKEMEKKNQEIREDILKALKRN